MLTPALTHTAPRPPASYAGASAQRTQRTLPALSPVSIRSSPHGSPHIILLTPPGPSSHVHTFRRANGGSVSAAAPAKIATMSHLKSCASCSYATWGCTHPLTARAT
ncbi:hypothetical protein FA95DRAFT_1612343 [Auriscalpium vulgare]|uniref:Uncharacterized protein n=1 Tax=Auriscalpium vulgare TaxID=40419 RepID=A0ACB8R756_9AGAM|nr:hypothetical protein FA95DRAFT_1612343 [Auriscalpium vulgare]